VRALALSGPAEYFIPGERGGGGRGQGAGGSADKDVNARARRMARRNRAPICPE